MLWRISNYPDLSGEGSGKVGGRWNSRGSKIVYFADSPTAAILETLVHMEVDGEDTPTFYTLLKVIFPESFAVLSLDIPTNTEWKENLDLTRLIGDKWLVSLETALARIPSALAPHTWNYLLNPLHPDAKQVQIDQIIHERFDLRLFRSSLR